MKRICTLLMAVLFLSVTAVSAQDATTKSKKEVKKELGQKLKKETHTTQDTIETIALCHPAKTINGRLSQAAARATNKHPNILKGKRLKG